jgi:hypothetical protein
VVEIHFAAQQFFRGIDDRFTPRDHAIDRVARMIPERQANGTAFAIRSSEGIRSRARSSRAARPNRPISSTSNLAFTNPNPPRGKHGRVGVLIENHDRQAKLKTLPHRPQRQRGLDRPNPAGPDYTFDAWNSKVAAGLSMHRKIVGAMSKAPDVYACCVKYQCYRSMFHLPQMALTSWQCRRTAIVPASKPVRKGQHPCQVRWAMVGNAARHFWEQRLIWQRRIRKLQGSIDAFRVRIPLSPPE